MSKGVVLYLGGFILPDKNAAAQRVVGIAKGLRELGFEIIFINNVKDCLSDSDTEKRYFGFKASEYKRENAFDYLVTAKTAIGSIKKYKPDYVITYNYPAASLNRIRSYCQKNNIKCIADVTEWPIAVGGSFFYRLIKRIDTSYRMKVIHKRLDGIIAISKYLFDYYRSDVKTVIIPPTVDMKDGKWDPVEDKKNKNITLVYAGSPSAVKEKLDLIVTAVEESEKSIGIRLDVVGITKEQFIQIYNWSKPISESVVFWGRVDHEKAIFIVKNADWSIIIRDNNRVSQAGFPTKLVESISCGIPVIANEFGDVRMYLNDNNSIIVENTDRLPQYINQCAVKKSSFDTGLFDYHNYLEELKDIFNT